VVWPISPVGAATGRPLAAAAPDSETSFGGRLRQIAGAGALTG